MYDKITTNQRKEPKSVNQKVFQAYRKKCEEVSKEKKYIATPFRKPVKIGRNEKCYCGSGLKYKKCCGRDD